MVNKNIIIRNNYKKSKSKPRSRRRKSNKMSKIKSKSRSKRRIFTPVFKEWDNKNYMYNSIKMLI